MRSWLEPAPAGLPEPACTAAPAVTMHAPWALPAPGSLSAWSLVHREPTPSTTPRFEGHFLSLKADSSPNSCSDSKPLSSHGSHAITLVWRERDFFPPFISFLFPLFIWSSLCFSAGDCSGETEWTYWWNYISFFFFLSVLVLPKFLQKYLSQRLRLVPKFIIVICHSYRNKRGHFPYSMWSLSCDNWFERGLPPEFCGYTFYFCVCMAYVVCISCIHLPHWVRVTVDGNLHTHFSL